MDFTKHFTLFLLFLDHVINYGLDVFVQIIYFVSSSCFLILFLSVGSMDTI